MKLKTTQIAKTKSGLSLAFVALGVLTGCFSQNGNNALDPLVKKEEGDGSKVGNSALTFDVAALDFGDIPLSPSYLDKTIKVTNSVKVDMFIKQFKTDKTVFSILSTDCPATGSLALGAGQSCNVTVRFSPTAFGPISANLEADYGGTSAEPEKFKSTLGMSGTSVQSPLGNSGFLFTPGSLDFGNIAVAPSFGEKTIVIKNNLTYDLYFGVMTANNPLFVVHSTTCPVAVNTPLAPGAQCQAVVRLSPTSEGEHLGYLSIAYGTSAGAAGSLQAQAALSGRSYASPVGNSAISFSPGYWDFGDVPPGQNSTKQIQLRNEKTTPVYISSILSDNTSLYTITANTCPSGSSALNPSTTCNITIRFAPTVDGASAANIAVSYGPDQARNTALSTALVVVGRSTTNPYGNSMLGFSPTYWDFGDVAPNTTVTKDVTLTNTTSSSVSISGITRTNSSIYGLTHNCPATLTASANCTLTISYTPTTDGVFTSDVVVTYGPDVARNTSVQSKLVMAGRATTNPIGNSSLSFAPNFWDFGDVAANVTVSKQITVSNANTVPIYISAYTQASSVPEFTVSQGTCPASPVPLAAGANCSVTVSYRPTSDGGYSTDLKLVYGLSAATSSNYNSRMSLTGRSTASPLGNGGLTFTPSYYDFGNVGVGSNTSNSFTIQNTSSVSIYISGFQFDNNRFTVTSNLCPSATVALAAGATCTITGRFTPSAEGALTSTLSAAYGPDSARNTALTSKMTVIGRSISNPTGNTSIGFNPDFHDYGDLGVGTSASTTFTISNTGTQAVYFGGYSTGNAVYTITGQTCPSAGSATSLGAGSNCTITVRFAPAAAGTVTSNLTVSYGQDQSLASSLQSKITLAGRSTASTTGNSAVTLSPDYYDFGNVGIGNNSTKSFTLTNNSLSDIYLSGASFDNAKFTVTSNLCPSSTVAFQPGATCTITGRFAPTAEGSLTSTMTVSYGPDSPRASNLRTQITVIGRSIANPVGNTSIAFTPDFKDFGDLAVGAGSSIVFTLANTGSMPVYMGNYAIGDASFFITAQTCPTAGSGTPLGVSATCTVTVRFSPTATGSVASNLTVSYGQDVGANTALQAKLPIYGRSSAASTGNSALSFAPAYWDFGDVAASTTVNKAITLTNASAESVYISNITRTNSTLFPLTHDCPTSPSPLTAGSTCTITYSFAPTADGTQSSTATIAYGPDAPRSANLNAKFVVSGRSTAIANGNPSISFSPNYWDFGDVAANTTSDKEITLTNSSSAAIYMSGSLTSSNAVFLTLPSTSPCPTGSSSLAAGATCKIKIRFAPTTDGGQSTTITVPYGPDQVRNGNLSANLLVAGRSYAAPTGADAISFTPGYYDFQDVAANQTVTVGVTVANTSASPVNISAISRTNTSLFTLTHNCPTTPTQLAAGDSCVVTANFKPVADGVQTSDLSVVYGPDHPRSGNLTRKMTLNGRSTAAATGNSALTFSPTSSDYGNIAAGQTQTTAFTVTNSSSSAVQISALASSGSKFTITSHTCPISPTALAAAGTCTVNVRYSPTADGSDSSNVTIAYGPDAPRNANLVAKLYVYGRSEAAAIGNTAIGFTPSYYDFGDVAAGVTVQHNFTVTNNSTASVYLSGVTISNATVFSLSDNCPRSPSALASTNTCTATIKFRPTADGGQTSDLSVIYGPDDARKTNLTTKMSVAGRSTAVPVGNPGITFNPSYYNYGNVTAGSDSSKVVTISNTGTSSLYISGVTATGTTEFSITANTCPASPAGLAPAGTCDITVKYTPTNEGEDGGELQIKNGPDVDRAANLVAKMTLIARSVPIPIGNSALVLNPNNWDYGNVAMSPSYADKAIVVTNNSTSNIYIGAVTGLVSPYTVASNSCPAAPTALAPAAGCTVNVRFSPVIGAQATATLSLKYGQNTSSTQEYLTQATFTGKSNPVAPSNFKFASNTANSVTFTWENNALDASSFDVERCDGASCETTWLTAATANTLTAVTSYTWGSLTEGQLYRFRVRTVVSSVSSTWLTSTLGFVFGGINASDNGTGSTNSISQINCSTTPTGTYVRLNWNSVANASYYQIFDSLKADNPFVTNVSAPASGYILTGLSSGVAKNYSVQAVAVLSTGTTISSLNAANVSATTTAYSPCFVVGQGNDVSVVAGVTTTTLGPNNISLDYTLYQPRSIYSDGTRFFAADQGNHRVLIWNSMPNSLNSRPDVVLGQPTRYSNTANNGGRTARTLNTPQGVYYDGTRLYVADSGNHRVLIWNTLPTADFTAADVVLGQANFGAGGANNNQAACNTNATARGKGLSTPYGIVVVGTKLIVSDYANNRLMVWNTIPTTNTATADYSIGSQTANFTQACGAGVSASTFTNPAGLYSNGTNLVVVDRGNHRTLIFNSVPTGFGTNAASNVIGQTTMTAVTAGTTRILQNQPWAVSGDGSNLYVADYANHRVVMYSPPFSDGMNGTAIVGQTAWTGGAASNAGTGLNGPIAVWGNNASGLWVASYTSGATYSRLSQHALPLPLSGVTTNPATHALGQARFSPNYTTFSTGNALDAKRTSRPYGIYGVDVSNKLVATDNQNNRLLLWNSMPKDNLTSADIVLGQSSFTAGEVNAGGATSQSSLSAPRGVWTDGTRLFAVDGGNHRVLIWKTWPTANNQSADLVLGQSTWTGATASNAATGLNLPSHVSFVDAGGGLWKIFVTEQSGCRIRVYNVTQTLLTLNPPTASNSGSYDIGTTASIGSGASCVTGTAATSMSLSAPRSHWTDGTKFAVADTGNNRVLLWNSAPTGPSVAADIALGQFDVNCGGTTGCGSANQGTGAPTAATLSSPTHVWYTGTKLYVVDQGNHRILVWNDWPTTMNQEANAVIGQSSFSTNLLNNGLTQPLFSTFQYPVSMWMDGGRMFVTDGFNIANGTTATNNRIVVFPAP